MMDEALGSRTSRLQTSDGLRRVFLGLRRCGLSVEQASNLTAHLEGIRPVAGGWTLDEIARLQFTRWLVTAGLLGTDDAAIAPEYRMDEVAA
jgi:hypothetical protein